MVMVKKMIKIDQTIALADAKIEKIRKLKDKRMEFVSSGIFPGTGDVWPEYKTFYTGIEACETVQEVLDYPINFS